jgi:hypothetical protein
MPSIQPASSALVAFLVGVMPVILPSIRGALVLDAGQRGL